MRTRLLAVVLAVAVTVTTLALFPVASQGQARLVMVFVPSRETDVILTSGQRLGKMIDVATGIKTETVVATSYTAAIEAMCTGRADIGWLNTFSYVLAHDKCGVEVSLITVRFGIPYYRAQINVRSDSPINKVEDLRGKRFAFSDPASTSGYLFPAAMLKKMGFDPDRFFGQTVFAGSHVNVILAVYRGQVDGGATFDDARTLIQRQFPDVTQRIKVIARTDPIPNDTVSLRRDLPADVKAKLKARLLAIAKTQDGKDALNSLYSIEDLTDKVLVKPGDKFAPMKVSKETMIPVGDWFFQPVRDVAKFLGIDLARLAR